MPLVFNGTTRALRPGDTVTEDVFTGPSHTDSIVRSVRIERRSLIELFYYGLVVVVSLVEGIDLSNGRKVMWTATDHRSWLITR